MTDTFITPILYSMDTKEDTNEKSISIKLTLKPAVNRQAMFLMKHLEAETLQDLVRNLINSAFVETKDAQLRYGKGPSDLQNKKTKQEEAIKRMRSVSAPELQEYLLEIGFILADHDEEEGGDIELRERIEDQNGKMVFIQQRFSKSRGVVEYSREVYADIDSIINAVLKEKLL